MLDKMKKYSGWWKCPNKDCGKMNRPNLEYCDFCRTTRER